MAEGGLRSVGITVGRKRCCNSASRDWYGQTLPLAQILLHQAFLRLCVSPERHRGHGCGDHQKPKPKPKTPPATPPPPTSVDATKTRSDPQRVRMSSGERPIGAAKGKQPNTEALCPPPPPPRDLTSFNNSGLYIRYGTHQPSWDTLKENHTGGKGRAVGAKLWFL